MKKILVSKATNNQLDWLVATCQGYKDANEPLSQHDDPEEELGYFNWCMWRGEGTGTVSLVNLRYCDNPALMYPIIFKEEISTIATGDAGRWKANVWVDKALRFSEDTHGDTPLIAAARCLVSLTLGREVEVPEEFE